jgi:hypothetical protein
MFRRLRKLTDFELGLTLFRAHKRVDHLRACKPCRESRGFMAYIMAVLTLHAIRRECRLRGIDVSIVPVSEFTAVDLTEPGIRLRSIYEIPVSVN